jgi:ABC-2 type transport system permease protein
MVYVAMAAFPASYFLVLTLRDGAALGRHALLGAMIGFSVNAGVISLPQVVLTYRARGLQEMFVASPVRPFTYAVGMALSRLIYIAPPLLVMLVLFPVVSGVGAGRALVLAPLLGLSWFTGSLIGFGATRRWDDPAGVAAMANMLGLVLVLLPPVYYPLDLLPAPLTWPVLLVPTANIAELAREVTGLSDVDVLRLGYQAVALAVTIVGCVWFTSRDRHWREP